MQKRLLRAGFLWLIVLCGLLAREPARAEAPQAADLHAPVRTVAVGDAVLGYRVLGTGKPLLCITGYGCTMEAWDPRLLAALAARHMVIVFDNRGMGASTASGTPFSLSLFADDAAGLLAALGLDRADVLGWSMGAMTALEMALVHPERVDKVVAYGAAAEPGPVVAAVDRMQRMSPAAFAAQLFPQAWAEAHPEALSHLPRPAMPPDPASVGRQREALASWPGFDGRLAGLDKAVLLVVGQEDTITPPEQSLKLAGMLPGAWLVRFRAAGHWLMYQTPGDLARVVEDFLDVREDLGR
jgi:pimeloyl-ACP methyl ester carboxylesterase